MNNHLAKHCQACGAQIVPSWGGALCPNGHSRDQINGEDRT